MASRSAGYTAAIKRVEVLRGLDMDVRPGEVVALLGAKRRGQDHDDRDPDNVAHARRRHRNGRGPRRRHRARVRTRRDRRHRPVGKR